MKKLLLLVSGLILAGILVACGSGNNNNDNNNDTASVDGAEEIYKNNCASCHGDDLKGDTGPNLQKVGNDMSEDEIREKIKTGGNIMPENIIDGDEADKVAAWLADKK